MKHAFLIQAHEDPEQLYNLIQALNAKDSLFYVHIDKKASDFTNSIFYQQLLTYCNVHFTERIKVYWGGFSQVKATLILLNEAIKESDVYYFHFLSGHDYPIKGIDYILTFFENNNKNYLNYIPEESKLKHFIDRYYFYDNDYINPRNKNNSIKRKVIRSSIIFIQRITWFFVQVLKFPIRKRIDMKYYHGSCWFSFTKKAVNYILTYIQRNPWILKRFNYTACPDESFFTMLLMNNDKFRNRIFI